ncbi:O-methyltransferase [Salegentibacter sp. F14]
MWLRYLKFLLKSQNQHGLHSPFVYELVTRCFYDKTNYPQYEVMEAYRKELLEDKRKITVTDFGAGSRVFKSKEREVAAIARNVGIPRKRAKFLFRLAKYLECKNILELGTSLGIGTSALALNESAQVTSIEGCPQTSEVARAYLKKFGFENVNLEVGAFEQVLTSIRPGSPLTMEGENRTKSTFDLVYFDGHHTREATLKYFELLLEAAHNDSVFVFDDIHWSPGMEQAWETITQHPKVRVSIDTFYLGLIFFRKEQVKQDFIIRL